MSPAVLVACLLAGVGTWAFRVVPLFLAGRRAGEGGGGRSRAYLDAFLAAMAVASVAALLTSGAEPYLSQAVAEARAGDAVTALKRVAAVAAGLGVTAVGYAWRRGVALGTLGGAAAYGLATWLLGLA